MRIDFFAKFTPEERRKFEEQIDLTQSVRQDVKALYDYHMANSNRWYPHVVVPWGAGVDYVEKEWTEEQASLRPEIRMALETNLLTEDNLPYYHEQLSRFLSEDEVWTKWNNRWTAEEGKHGAAIRDYLYLTRNADPVEMEDNRMMIMEAGFARPFDPVSIFVYTAVQELATRVSHSNTGRIANEPILLNLLRLISTDENFHFIFYRGVVTAMLKLAPEIVLEAMVKELYSFNMPGVGMKDFKQRMEISADLGIYGPLEHRDQVVKPLLKYWDIENLKGLSSKAQALQEKTLKVIKLLDRVVEARDRKKKKSDT